MSDTGKKIIFEGVDAGAFNMLDLGKKKGIDMYNAFAKGALEHTKNTKEALSYVEQSIKAYEKELKLLGTYKQHLAEINVLHERLNRTKSLGGKNFDVSQFTQGAAAQSTMLDLEKAKKAIFEVVGNQWAPVVQEGIKGRIDKFFPTSDKVSSVKQLHKYLEVEKGFGRIDDVAATEAKINSKLTGATIGSTNSGRGKSTLTEAEGIEKLNDKTQEVIDTLKDQHGEKVNEDKKNAEKISGGKAGGGKELTPEEELNKKAQQGKNDTEKQKSIFSEVLKANIVTEIGKSLLTKLGNISNTIVNAQSGESLLADSISAIPSFGLSSMIGVGLERRNNEQFKVENAANRLAGLTGRFKSGFSNNKAIPEEIRFGSIHGASDYGYGMSETLGAEEQFTKSKLGRVSQKDVFDALAAEKNFTLGRGTVSNMFDIQSKSSSSMSPLENIAQIMQAMPSLKLDSTALEDVIKLQSGLIEENSKAVEKGNRGQVTSMIKDFRSIDSDFFQNPQRLAPIIASINQSLQSPTNDYAKARNFKILSELNPGADYFELIKMQSRGASQSGFLQKTLEDTMRRGGDPRIALTGKQYGGGGILNLLPEVAEQVSNAFKKNHNLFSGWDGNEENILGITGTAAEMARIRGGATGKVSVREKEMVEISDAFVMGIDKGMEKLAHEFGNQLRNEIDKVIDVKKLGTIIANNSPTIDIVTGLSELLARLDINAPHQGTNGKRK